MQPLLPELETGPFRNECQMFRSCPPGFVNACFPFANGLLSDTKCLG